MPFKRTRAFLWKNRSWVLPTISLVCSQLLIGFLINLWIGNEVTSFAFSAVIPLIGATFSAMTENKLYSIFLKDWKDLPVLFHLVVIAILFYVVWLEYLKPVYQNRVSRNLIA